MKVVTGEDPSREPTQMAENPGLTGFICISFCNTNSMLAFCKLTLQGVETKL